MKRMRTKAQIAADKRRTGRPPLPASQKKGRFVQVRVTEAQLRQLKSEARRRGCTVADLLLGPWRKES